MMETIYWLQVIGSLSTVVATFFVVLLAALTGLCLYRGIGLNSDLCDLNEDKRVFRVNMCYKYMRNIGIGMTICLLGSCFIPSEKQMYAIYGIGGTIDYLKDNETAKQLPDKVIIALDKYIDCLNEDKEKND